MKYYCQQMGSELGPMSYDRLRSMAISGEIFPDTFVRTETSHQWTTADAIGGLFELPKSPSPLPVPAAPAIPTNHSDVVLKNQKHGLYLVIAGLGATTGGLFALLMFVLLHNAPNEPDMEIALPKPTAQDESSSVEFPIPDLLPAHNERNNRTEFRHNKPDPRPERPSQPKIYRMNEPAIVGGLAYQVAGAFWSEKLSSNEFLDTPPRASYLVLTLAVVNGYTEPYMLPPLALIDENGTEYGPSANDWMLESSMAPIEILNPEVPVVANVAFDVPRNHRYRLRIRAGVLSSETAYIALNPQTPR